MNMDVNAIKQATRGKVWFDRLTQNFERIESGIESLQIAEGKINNQIVRVFCITADTQNRFPRARNGEVGLLEGWGLAHAVNQLIEQDQDASKKRGILCLVDVPSQAYGRREESLGIHQALAAAVDSYARARLAGHAVVSLLVGKSMSGAFLAHGYQANRILALKDSGVMVHAMGKESAARVTLRTVEELEQLAQRIPPMAYDIENYASLGLLSGLIEVESAEDPTQHDLASVTQSIAGAFEDIQQQGRCDLSHRLQAQNRQASLRVRELMKAQWS